MAYKDRPTITELRQWAFGDGMTGRAIAKKLGLPTYLVQRWLREAGLIRRIRGIGAVPIREVTNGVIAGSREGKLYFIDYTALDWMNENRTMVWMEDRVVQLPDLCEFQTINILDDAGEIARTVEVRGDVLRVGDDDVIEVVSYCFDPLGKIWYIVFRRDPGEPELSPRGFSHGKVFMSKVAARRRRLIE